MEYKVVKNEKYPMWYMVDSEDKICRVSMDKEHIITCVLRKNKELNDRS